jgi:small-conductance mechanosensitive channel
VVESLREFIDTISPIGPAATVIALILIAMVSARRIVRRKAGNSGATRLREQLVSVFISALGVLLVILVLPMTVETRGQLLNLIGLAATAVIALSSTTVVANAMAGLMIRFARNLGAGDMIQVGEHVGRVTSFGLFHTEIQTETRDLTSLPNLHLISNPVQVVRESGTFMTCDVSLGYDVHHKRIEELLLKAAEATDLETPAVHIRDLLDHAVTYRIAGFTADTSHLFTIRSKLRSNILDALQDGGVEIVSPSYMYQRPQPDGTRTLPRKVKVAADTEDDMRALEDLAFDKATHAEALVKLNKQSSELQDGIKQLKSDLGSAESGKDKDRIEREISFKERRLERVTGILESASNQDENE